MKTGIWTLLLGVSMLGCASQKGGPSVRIEEGAYQAEVKADQLDETTRAYSMTSQIGFTFEKDNTFIYKVRAMGKEVDDVGKWEVRGDSLYIFDLQRGPNSVFHIMEVSPGQYEIKGPNHFTLTKQAPVEALKN